MLLKKSPAAPSIHRGLQRSIPEHNQTHSHHPHFFMPEEHAFWLWQGECSGPAIAAESCRGSSRLHRPALCRQLAGLQPDPHATTQQATPHHTTAPTLQQIPRTFAQRHYTNSLKPGRPKEATTDLTLLSSPISTQGTCMQSPVNARKEKRDLIKKHRVYSTDELYKYSAG